MQSASADKNFLLTDPIKKLLIKLSVPTITAQIVNLLYNMVDRIYIGRIEGVGDLALTGVGVCLPIIIIVSAFQALFCSGGAPKSSIFMGMGDNERAEKTMGNCFGMLIVIAAILSVGLLAYGEEILLSFGASANTIPYAYDYLSIYSLGTLFVQISIGMNLFVTAQGFTKVSMTAVVLGAVTNIILDPIFIFTLEMGVAGAALATIIAQGLSAVYVVAFLVGKKTKIKLSFKNMIPKANILIPCVSLGISTFIMQVTTSATLLAFNASLLKYGGDIAVGAMTISSSIMNFALLPLQGLGQGAQPIIGHNFGARNVERVKATFALLLKICLTFSITLWVFVMAFPQIFASIFTADPAFIEYSVPLIRVYMFGTIFFGAQMACQMTFVAIGRAPESILAAMMRKVILLIPLIYILPPFFTDKTFAVFLAEPVADLIAVAFTCVLFTFRFKVALKSISEKTA